MYVPLEPDKYYHIYNRANGSDNLFVNDGNYHFFLKRFFHFISPIANSYAYCLMPNHFHFLVKIKSDIELSKHFNSFSRFQSSDTLSFEKLISKQFSNLFSSYTQAFNKQQNRRGSLFLKNFKRKYISDNKYLLELVIYIHLNPVNHNFCDHPRDWKLSSYNTILSEIESDFTNKEVITWFEDKANFIHCHNKKH